MTIRLDLFDNGGFRRGRPKLVEVLWLLVGLPLLTSGMPGNAPRRWLLRWFGAKIGTGVVIKPRVRVKFPWRLEIGDHSWIGENVWIDNLASVTIGDHVCISQGAYLCTGSHDWGDPRFSLRTSPIILREGAWVGAMSRIAPGVLVEEEAVLAMGSVAVSNVGARAIWQGNPATLKKPRYKNEP